MRYKTFYIPKRNGGKRKIEAPDEELKKVQYEFMKKCRLFRQPASLFAHGFVKDRNTATAMLPHVKKKYVIKFDIKDFFNSIKWESWKTLKTQRTTEKICNKCRLKECLLERCFAGKDKHLPQGAPTSPYLANLYMWSFDYMVAKTASQLEVDYTRYADELIFSSNNDKIFVIEEIIRRMLEKEKLKLNDKKTRIFRNRKCLLSIVVNEKLNIPRKLKKNLRAAMFQVKMGQREVDEKLKGELAYTNAILNNDKESFDSTSYYLRKQVAKAL